MKNHPESIETKFAALTARLHRITREDLSGVEEPARYLTVASGWDVPEEVVWEFHGEAWESLEDVLSRASQVASRGPSEGAWEVLVLDQIQGRLEGVLSLQEGQFSYRSLEVSTG